MAWRSNIALIVGIAAVLALGRLVAAPGFDDYTRNLLQTMGIVALMAVSLALVNGVTGQFSLGHAAFQAVGAYVAAGVFALIWSNPAGNFDAPNPLDGRDPWMLWACAWGTILLGGIVAAIVGFVVALPCARLRGDYLAIVTLGFNEIVGVVIRAQGNIGRVDLGGPRGFNLPRGIAGGFGDIYLVLLVALIVLGRLVHSARGLAFAAVREDELAAEAIGIDATRTKLLAFTVSSFFAGIAGGLYAFKTGAISDRTFDTLHSIDYVVMVLLGGNGPLLGALAAAVGLTWLNDRLREADELRMIAYGFLLVWIMVARVPSLLSRALRFRGRPPVVAAAVPAALHPAIEAGSGRDGSRHEEGEPVLALDDVSLRFGGLRAVEGLSLKVDRGEFVGLIGPNGAGKSTVFNLISGLYRPTSGAMAFEGSRLLGSSPHRRVSLGMSRTFQNIRLFKSMTVLDNVRAGCLVRHPGGTWGAMFSTPANRRAEEAIAEEAQALIEVFGLSPLARATAGELPYGTQRRLEIARALATRPTLLLLDEPAAGMNPAEKAGLGDLLRDVHRRHGLSLLLIEHDMSVVAGLCSHVVVLDEGRKIAEGSPEQVRDDPAVIEAYLGPEDGGAD